MASALDSMLSSPKVKVKVKVSVHKNFQQQSSGVRHSLAYLTVHKPLVRDVLFYLKF